MFHIKLDHIASRASLCTRVLQTVSTRSHLHIVSLNPEIMMIARSDAGYRHILSHAGVQIVDGVGVYLALRQRGIKCERLTGVDIMDMICRLAADGAYGEITIALVGGMHGVAESLAARYQSMSKGARFVSMGDRSPDDASVMSEIAACDPAIVIVAYGSPVQERWIETHAESLLAHSVCMGVGGAMDMLAGRLTRAPHIMRRLGLEWLYRLICEPWRWRRQLRLIEYMYYVVIGR